MVLICLHISVEGHLVIPWTVPLMNESISFVQCLLTECSVTKSQKGTINLVDKFLPLDDVFTVWIICEASVWYSTNGAVDFYNREDKCVWYAYAKPGSSLSMTQVASKVNCRVLNKKDQLFNYLIDLSEERTWNWVNNHNTLGKSFLLNLQDALWYINGYYAAFENRSLLIPEIFNSFPGCNNPELSKHQKRKMDNMSYDALISYVIFEGMSSN